jgi:hypothetical protein
MRRERFDVADRALIFEDKTVPVGTHVLLIGIGDYPWLEGGAKCTTAEQQQAAMGMGQLGAPPRSARALADWFLDGFDNPEKPLASLALILSEPTQEPFEHDRVGEPKKVPRGEIAEIKKAVEAWTARANTNRANGVVFTFCGHGLQAGDPVLLCRDYAESALNRFAGAINFEEFRIALSTQQPDTQLLLVDACRTPDVETALLGQKTPGDAMLSLAKLSTRDDTPALQSIHFATSLYTEAWGRATEPSLFTGALLDALRGGGADSADDWWVTTSRLHSALSTYLARISRAEGIVQRPAAQTQEFRISKPPQITVPVYVESTQPAVWNHKLTVEALRGDVAIETFRHVPPPAPGFTCALRLTNPTQDPLDVLYDLRMVFAPASVFSDCSKKIIAYPPEVTWKLTL